MGLLGKVNHFKLFSKLALFKIAWNKISSKYLTLKLKNVFFFPFLQCHFSVTSDDTVHLWMGFSFTAEHSEQTMWETWHQNEMGQESQSSS